MSRTGVSSVLSKNFGRVWKSFSYRVGEESSGRVWYNRRPSPCPYPPHHLQQESPHCRQQSRLWLRVLIHGRTDAMAQCCWLCCPTHWLEADSAQERSRLLSYGYFLKYRDLPSHLNFMNCSFPRSNIYSLPHNALKRKDLSGSKESCGKG